MQWKSWLEANSNSWIITDRGNELVAVWDIIKINHDIEFGEISEVLKMSWEKMTDLKASDDLQVPKCIPEDSIKKTAKNESQCSRNSANISTKNGAYTRKEF